MMCSTVRAAMLAMLAVCVCGDISGIGDRLVRTYTKYVPLPTTAGDAISKGWKAEGNGSCIDGLGVAYAHPESRNTTRVYFTKAGQAGGYSVDVYGAPPPQQLISAGYFMKVGEKHYRISLAFRSPADACSEQMLPQPVGDRVVLAPATANRHLPLTVQGAKEGNWTKGACFSGMGHHWFYDVKTAPVLSWEAANLFPVVPMYNNAGLLQAVFFASWTVQQGVTSSHDWEPVALANPLMCENFCDSKCHFKGTEFWSTYHVYFRALDQATCNGGCKIHCCEDEL